MKFQKIYMYSVRVLFEGEAETPQEFDVRCANKLDKSHISVSLPSAEKGFDVKQSVKLNNALMRQIKIQKYDQYETLSDENRETY